MKTNRLWAPWRFKYIRSKTIKECIFCAAANKKVKPGVVFRTKHSIALLNIFPYNNGHIMVAPLKHVKDLSGLSESEYNDLWKTVLKIQKALKEALRPQGYNIGLNIGTAAGAGIPAHLHVHIVPRWQGDTNFMPVISNTKVISQSLSELEKKLRKCLIK